MSGASERSAALAHAALGPLFVNLVRRLKSWITRVVIAIAMAGCASAVPKLPPQVTYTEIQPSGVAAKPFNCDMKVLNHDPLSEYRKVGIIEAEGSVYATEEEVLPAVRRKACETGADAIIVVTSKSQTTENIVGYYINAIAIVYGKNTNIPYGPHISH